MNEISEVKRVLLKLQEGYTGRDIEKIDDFMEELFVRGDDTYAVGTSTGELFLGSKEVKELLAGDWEYWGDVNIDSEDALITTKGEVAWFATSGTVKYTFEDNQEKYDRHIHNLKAKVEEKGLTPTQKLAYINWFLSLVYHQREAKKRTYLWPVRLSGVLIKDGGNWKFAHLTFSISKGNFPDERFENSEEYIDNYKKQMKKVEQYRNNQIDEELEGLLKKLQTEFFGQREVSEELISQYFAIENVPYIIAPEDERHVGEDAMSEFFALYKDSTLSLDTKHAIASKYGEIACVTVTGTLKQELSEEELAERTLEELIHIFESKSPSKNKLFNAHRSVAYAWKESAIGKSYTYPIRLTAILINSQQGLAFHSIHFSYPSYWILEGKL